MTLVVVPVRYPLTNHSKNTLQKAIGLAERENAELTVLHVNLYQRDCRVTRRELRQGIEREFGAIDRARYVVRDSFLVEETILDEVAGERADFVVIGRKQVSRWRSAIRRLLDEPDIESYLHDRLDCELVPVTI